MTRFPRITRNPAVMSGRACLRDSHVTASTIVTLLAAGHSHEEVIRMFPMLTPEDLQEALAYAAWWIDEQEPPLPASESAQHLPSPVEPLPQPPMPSAAPNEPEAPSAQESIPEAVVEAEGILEDESLDDEDLVEESLEAEPFDDETLDADESSEAAPDEETEVEETLELFHPDYPDQATVVITRHGIFDRRWGTHTIAWSDIREIHRIRSKKTVDIILRNPEFYLTSMPFFKRLRAQIRLALNIQTLQLDTSSLGIRTKDLYLTANRLWVRHRGRVRFRKKRRVRVDGKSNGSRRAVEWDRYQPM